MQIRINGKISIDNVLRASGHPVKGKYYHLPMWFEREGDSFIVHHESDLPKELKAFIKPKNILSRLFKNKRSCQ